jgi:hypothetical protein
VTDRPDIEAPVVHFIGQDEVSWDIITDNPMQPFLVELHDPHAFAAKLPLDFQPPTQNNPRSGLPPNVWVGCLVSSRHDLRRAEQLVDVAARIRWLRVRGLSGLDLRTLEQKVLGAWRCVNCGHRGGRRPLSGRCPHSKVLCGDARLDSQIHWVWGDNLPYWFVEQADKWNVRVHPDPPDILDFKEFLHLKKEGSHAAL